MRSDNNFVENFNMNWKLSEPEKRAYRKRKKVSQSTEPNKIANSTLMRDKLYIRG